MMQSVMSEFMKVWLSKGPKGAKHDDAKYSADTHCDDSIEHSAQGNKVKQNVESGCIATVLLSKAQKH